jgi:hypothetical protein
MYPCATTAMVASRGPGGRLVVPRQVPAARDNGRAGELGIVYLKRWFVVTAIGLTLLVGLANCVVAPVAPVSPEYVVSPPVVVVPPYRPYFRYHPYRPYRPYRPYYGWYRSPYRW